MKKKNYLLVFLILLASISFQKNAHSQVAPCPGFTTYTQGGWGSSPSGNNPGTILQNNFASVFPDGITIGCTNKLVLTSAVAVKNFLPQGGSPKALSAGTIINPTRPSYSNVLAGQLVAATINVEFDSKLSSFGSSSINLKDLKISSGAFFNWTVAEVLAEANRFIGGCGSAYSASALNNILTQLNQAYDNGVVSTNNIFVCPITADKLVSHVKCFGESNGSIQIIDVDGGAGAPYTYLWSNGATSASITGLTAGEYTVTIKDRIGLSTTMTIIVTEPPLLVANVSATEILCFGGSSIITVSASGGTPPYSGVGEYTVTAGTYNYTVTDANGCSTPVEVVVSEPSLLVASSSATEILCHGGSSLVTVSASGGTPPYSGVGEFSVTAGTYNYIITDANGCSATTEVVVSEPSLLVASSSATEILCYGGSSLVTVSASGGTPPYSGIGEFNVGAGTYNYIITDANGCSATTEVVVSEPSLLVASSSATEILCYGGSSLVTVSASGGTPPYSGIGEFNVGAGTYNYIITDANGCSATTEVVVSEPRLLEASSSATEISCFGGSSIVTVSASGGTPPYSGIGEFNVGAGTYNYTVIDANGCSATTEVRVSEPSLLEVDVNSTKILCYGGLSTMTVSASGGTPPYSGIGEFNVPAGTYNYTVTDANGCSATVEVSIGEPRLLEASSVATRVLCYGDSTTVFVSAVGGTTPYTGVGEYRVVAGTYNYIITDANGCSAETSIIVSEPQELTLSGITTASNDCNGDAPSGVAEIFVSGGTGPYSYVWSNGAQGINALTQLVTNSELSVVVTDVNGCARTYFFEPITCERTACDPLKTFTQGGWGAVPNGNNPGVYLTNNFAAAFPAGLKIGSVSRGLVLTTASAVTNFLPSGGTPAVLPLGTLTNPTTYSNTLAGQLVAATLSVVFDAYDANFTPSSTNLEDMYCNFAPFNGVSVAQLLAEANAVIGGGSSIYSISELNTALTHLNENYDNGTVDQGYFTCNPPVNAGRLIGKSNNVVKADAVAIERNFKLFPNPAISNFTVTFESDISTMGTVSILNLSGQLLMKENIVVTKGTNTTLFDLSSGEFGHGLMLIEVTLDGQPMRKLLMVK